MKNTAWYHGRAKKLNTTGRDAIHAVCTSNPGILKHDLDINHVKVDERLTG